MLISLTSLAIDLIDHHDLIVVYNKCLLLTCTGTVVKLLNTFSQLFHFKSIICLNKSKLIYSEKRLFLMLCAV